MLAEKNKLKSKALFYLSLITSACFVLSALDTCLIKTNSILIGVFRELLTIPLFTVQLILFVWSLFWYIKKNTFEKNYYMLWILLLSFVNILFVTLSFLI